ncbi:hypothetical protein MRX96_041411 [Rhipicephalus microplus]
MERELEIRVNLPVVRVNRGGLYVIIAVLGIVIIASLSVTGYSLHNYAMLKRTRKSCDSTLRLERICLGLPETTRLLLAMLLTISVVLSSRCLGLPETTRQLLAVL